MSKRAVDDELAVGRDADVAQHLDREFVLMHLLREAHRVVDRLLHPRGERNRLPLAAGDVDAPDLALAPDHDRLAVRRPGVLRIESVNRPGFLEILVDIAEQLTVTSG